MMICYVTIDNYNDILLGGSHLWWHSYPQPHFLQKLQKPWSWFSVEVKEPALNQSPVPVRCPQPLVSWTPIIFFLFLSSEQILHPLSVFLKLC